MRDLVRVIEKELLHPSRWVSFDGYTLRHANGWGLWLANEAYGLSIVAAGSIGGGLKIPYGHRRRLLKKAHACLGDLILRQMKEPTP